MQIQKWLIKSQDSYTKNLEIVSIKVKNSEDIFQYQYESKLGFCDLFFYSKENRITLRREGEESIFLELLVGEKTELQYQNSLYRDTFLVEGISCKGDLNLLDFSYRLLEKNGEEINTIHIQMRRKL